MINDKWIETAKLHIKMINEYCTNMRTIKLPKQNPFKVGDKVAVYVERKLIGIVVDIRAPGFFADNILIDCSPREIKYVSAHWKQCRRLVKKKRREIWVHKDSIKGELYASSIPMAPADHWIKFIEAK